MNKALKGNYQEILITKILNQKKLYWDKLPFVKEGTFAIHINSKKYGKINQEKIHPKADIYFAEGYIPHDFLLKNDYYLNESHVGMFGLAPIKFSGLSIKLPHSNYTIFKISPTTFNKIFKKNILGAGASIYCKNQEELIKNEAILSGWQVKLSDFEFYYCQKLNTNRIDLDDIETMRKIKTYSNNEIGKLIREDKVISDLIFKGIGNFEEPYTANWILENDELKKNYYIPFNITTGSGRRKEIFTIVLKPK